MTFKELPIGARFRQVNHQPHTEWVKVEPVSATAHRAGYNAQTVDGSRSAKVGHSTKVLVPPYGDTTGAKRQSKRYGDLKPLLLAKGWSSEAALRTAFLNGVVAVPQNPEKEQSYLGKEDNVQV
jgi:hypothetical protein